MTEEKKLNPLLILSTTQLLNFDPVDVAEKSDHPDPHALGAGLTVLKSEALQERMAAEGDVAFGTDLSKYLKVAESIGFKEVVSFPFDGDISDGSLPNSAPAGSAYKERMIVLQLLVEPAVAELVALGVDEVSAGYMVTGIKRRMSQHPDRLLLVLESYCETSVNDAELYFGGEFIDQETHYALHVSGSGGKRGAWHIDVRTGLRHVVSRLLPAIKLDAVWSDAANFMYLTSYKDWKLPKSERLAIERSRFNALPAEITNMIGTYSRRL